MKKSILFYILGLTSILFWSSCSDFLEEDPKGRLGDKNFFKTQNDLDRSIYALYANVAETQVNTNRQIPQWQGDDMTTHPASNKAAYREFDRYMPTDINKGDKECWKSHYRLVKEANYIILNANKVQTSKEEINIALGQAHYWRAYAYFVLVRVYGELPINKDDSINYEREKQSIEQVYNLIVSDLEKAIDYVATDYSKAPRRVNGVNFYITKQAAQATLSAVYMAMGGYPLKKEEAYKKAAEYAKKVIDGGYYILESSFSKVYSIENNYSKETVIGINYSRLFGVWSSQASQLSSTQILESSGGWNDCVGEIKFYLDYPSCERKRYIYSEKVRDKDGNVIKWWEAPEQQPVFRIFTFSSNNKGEEVDLDVENLSYYKGMTDNFCHRVIRYAEVLLWYAESQARADGVPNSLAYDCVNKVRRRAGLPDLPPGLSGTEFADKVAQEHGWEIAGNYVALVTRRADQLRLEQLESSFLQRAKNESYEVKPGIFLKDKVEFTNTTWNPDMIYAPIPDIDTSLDSNL